MSSASYLAADHVGDLSSAACRRRWWIGPIAVICLAAGVWAFPLRAGIVVGESMSPGLRSGQVFLMYRLPRGEGLARGDVVVFNLNGETLIKRVLALPGETVWGLDWSGEDGGPDYLLDEGEIPDMRAFLQRHPSIGRLVEVRVPRDCVYVVGDASGRSVDSRQFGPVPVGAIEGRLIRSAAEGGEGGGASS
jgi:signal peptidase I